MLTRKKCGMIMSHWNTLEFDYLLRTMPDTAQREVILEIIHKHKEYLASLESALAEDEQTA